MSAIAAAALSVSLASPGHGHAFVIGGTLRETFLVTSASAVGCSGAQPRCLDYVGIEFSDRPGLTYPAKVWHVYRSGNDATIAKLRVERGNLPAFRIAEQAALGDVVTMPSWCGDRGRTFVASVTQSGATVRLGAPASTDQAGCPLLNGVGQVVAMVRGDGDALQEQPGYLALEAVVSEGGGHSDSSWQFASASEALARVNRIAADIPAGAVPGVLEDQTMPWWCRAAELGDSTALNTCSRGLADGTGSPVDVQRALAMATALRDKGDPAGVSLVNDLEQRYRRRLDEFASVQKLAFGGDPKSDLTIADDYRAGLEGPADGTQADAWLERCATARVECAERLGTDILNGWHVLPDVPRGIRMLEQAGHDGSASAFYTIGKYYSDPFWSERYDPSKARHYFELAANNGSYYSTLARSELAKLPKIDPKLEAENVGGTIGQRIAAAGSVAETQHYGAAPIFRDLAASGDPHALLAAGLFFSWASAQRWSTNADDEIALRYFKEASAAGSYVGSLRAATSGLVTLDERATLLKLAMKQAQEASDSGDLAAAIVLGRGYEDGFPGGEPDCHRAATVFIAASSKKAPEAEFELGMLFTRDSSVGEIFPQNKCLDPREGAVWLRKAIDQGDYRAANRLAALLEGGRLGARDVAEAKRLYELAAEKGDFETRANAQARLSAIGP